MMKSNVLKDDGKKLYASDDELVVDKLYNQTVEFLHGHV